MAQKQSMDALLRSGKLFDLAECGLWYEGPMSLAPWSLPEPAMPRARHVAWLALAFAASVAVLLFV